MKKYIAKVIETIDNGPKRWNYIRVGIFISESDHEEKVHEYIRNYPSLINTFFPFVKNGKEYALYSPNYTATRILELPSGNDIGGEEPNSNGFCPGEYFVPTYIDVETETVFNNGTTKKWIHRVNNPTGRQLVPDKDRTGTYTPITPLLYYPFGFIAGCVWGDDSSSKIQYLDLSQVEKGIIKREERFGYVELADGIRLEKAIDMSDYMYDPKEEGNYSIGIAVKKKYDLRTGQVIE